MPDTSGAIAPSSDDLLERAGRVFSLELQVSRELHERFQRQWRDRKFRHVDQDYPATFEPFYAAVLGMLKEMQNPPEGFARVADWLRETAGLARAIRDGRGLRDTAGLYSGLYSTALSGFVAIGDAKEAALKKAQKTPQADDPLAAVLDRAPDGRKIPATYLLPELLSARAIAEYLNEPYGSIRKRLERLEKRFRDCATAVEKPLARGPRKLYRTAEVLPHLPAKGARPSSVL